LSRRSFVTLSPPYFDFQLKYVGRLMPCFLKISATGTPAAPSFRIATICRPANRDFRIEMPSRRASPKVYSKVSTR
jgi:hypothetical protein